MRKKSLLRIYLSKLKKVPSHLNMPSSPHPAVAGWLLSACKYPRTPSFAVGRDHPGDDGPDRAATLSDVDRFLHENFHSLYPREADAAAHDGSSSSSSDDPPPAAALRPSDRFFVSPATSSSLLEDARPGFASSSSSTPSCSSRAEVVSGGGMAVTTFSKDPYRDFRRSMEEMVEARHAEPGQALDWDFMEELLFCYLELNDRSVHKHILRAFTDLAVSFGLTRPGRAPAGDKGRRSRRSSKAAGEGRTAAPRHLPTVGYRPGMITP